MKLFAFSVFDSAAGAFLQPFWAPSVDYALRSFRASINDPQNDLSRFPEDFTLFLVGEFDQETGVISAKESPTSLGVAVTFMESPNAG